MHWVTIKPLGELQLKAAPMIGVEGSFVLQVLLLMGALATVGHVTECRIQMIKWIRGGRWTLEATMTLELLEFTIDKTAAGLT
jgi:hypothetical protein